MSDPTPEKYLFFYLRTGGGHLAPCRSLASYLTERYDGRITSELVDGLAEAIPYARLLVEDGYRIAQTNAKWYFELLYAATKLPPVGWLNVSLANLHTRSYVWDRIRTERPTKIIVAHFLLIAPVYETMREHGLDIPVITLVTDPFTAPPIWFQRPEQRYIVFSERLRDHCLSRGIPSSAITVFPFIIDRKFSTALPPERIAEVRARFGFDPAKKLVLIIGGGDGIPHGKRILKELLGARLPVQVAIVCGKSKELHETAMTMKKHYPELAVFGFVDFVYDLLNAADIIVTKCGASTIMEILMMKKVPVIIDYIWEQELGNMEFVRDNRLGLYERKMSRLPAVIGRLCTDEEYYQGFVDRITAMHLRNGTEEVGEFIAQWEST